MVDVGTFFPKIATTSFVVKNIAPNGKRIRVFQYPINNGATRDLLAIPGLSEDNIKDSLLKGELLIKLTYKEIAIVKSDIDLLQFNSTQLTFLKNAGITIGLQINPIVDLPYYIKLGVSLIGVQNNSNTMFTTPDKFIIDDTYNAEVYRNGIRLAQSLDYIFAESGGVGTGYDTVVFILFPPVFDDVLVIDYFVINNG